MMVVVVEGSMSWRVGGEGGEEGGEWRVMGGERVN